MVTSPTALDTARITIRHPLRMRRLSVAAVERPTPRLARLTLDGPDLRGFTSLAPDDHVKVFFPAAPDEAPLLPRIGPAGVEWPDDGPRPVARDYTPQRDGRGRLVLDVVLHGHGHAATWAADATVGARLGVAGPRGSHVLRRRFRRHVLLGDETALPAMRAWVDRLPPTVTAEVVVEVADATDEQPFPRPDDVAVTWVHRGTAAPGTTTALLDAARATPPRLGDAFVWLAGEAAAVRDLRHHLREERGHPDAALSARGYWRLGAPDHQEPHDD